jgi:cytochrome c oxidase cbb3-type subunit 4
MIDVNDLRVAVTLLSLLAFLGVVAWVALARNRPRFEAAARLPFADDEDARSGSA